MLNKSLIERLFGAFSIERWNDQIRPVPLVEMDKHAHKMAVAYCLARAAEEARGRGKAGFTWHNLIRGGLFELLRRCVLSDIKSPIYRELKCRYSSSFRRLSKWVYGQLADEVGPGAIRDELEAYLVGDGLLDEGSTRILDAAHVYASHWEFQVILRASGESEESRHIANETLLRLAPYTDLPGLTELLDREIPAGFLDLVAQLRFQVRWGRTPRLQRTSVLGHSMMVASLAYLLTREVRAPEACERRLRNNFFGGLFHDLPEAVTRDIISPVKSAIPGLHGIIGRIEKTLVRQKIYPLLRPAWRKEFRYFTENEFANKTVQGGRVVKLTPSGIPARLNKDRFEPYDGVLVEAADHLAALVEARKSIDCGVATPDLQKGAITLANRHEKQTVAGVDIGNIFSNWRG